MVFPTRGIDHGKKRSPICKYGLCKEELDQSGSMRLIENHAHGTRYLDIQWPLPSDSDNVLWIRLLDSDTRLNLTDQIRLYCRI